MQIHFVSQFTPNMREMDDLKSVSQPIFFSSKKEFFLPKTNAVRAYGLFSVQNKIIRIVLGQLRRTSPE